MAKLPKLRVPFNKPTVLGSEFKYIQDALKRNHLSGDGFYTEQCASLIRNFLKAKKVLLTPSCTHALELAALLLNLEPGDNVILPSFTFTSTANAFLLRGARPRFVDIRKDTLNMDERLVGPAVTNRTRVIVPVHYGGVVCEMPALQAISRKYHVPIVEDAAQALGSEMDGKKAGTFGALASFSFHETKNSTCGEGGALVLNDSHYITRAETLRQKGTNRSAFFKGKVNFYTWLEVGSSYVPSELQMAFLYPQLLRQKEIWSKRKVLFEKYRNNLQELETRGQAILPHIPSNRVSSYHNFYLILNDQKSRDRLIADLRKRGILAVFHYLPLHSSPAGLKFGFKKGQFPISEFISARIVRLPMFTNMNASDQRYVIDSVRKSMGLR